MRKILAIVILITAISTMSVFGSDVDSIDVSSMSEIDLALLIEKIQAELTIRSASPSDMIYDGAYEVGVDIASGMYTFYAVDYEDEDNCIITVYISKKDHDEKTQGRVADIAFVKPGDATSLKLEDGQYVVFSNNFLVKKPEQSFWTP